MVVYTADNVNPSAQLGYGTWVARGRQLLVIG
jgi:hypothetical protein